MKSGFLLLPFLWLSPARADEITVSAAASLREGVSQIAAHFERTYPNAQVSLNFGSSGALQKQIENGAPIDIFIAASPKNTRALQRQNIIETPRNFARGELVLIAPRGSKLKQLAELKNPAVRRVAIGGKGVPAGDYARQSLRFYGLNLGEKLVQGKDVRAVLAQVAAGNVDAGFVYRTDALASDAVEIVKPLEARSHQPIFYSVAVVRASKNRALAQKFVAFLGSPRARQILKSRGFLLP